jgi:hypothetical protein
MTGGFKKAADPRNPVKITGQSRLSRILNLVSTIIVAGALSAPALASPTCLLEVEGQRYLDGTCKATKDHDGRLVIGGMGGTSAVVRPHLGDSNRARGVWQDGPLGRVERLGLLEHDGTSSLAQ